MSTYEIEHVCPYCGKAQELLSHVDGEGLPEPGDLAICFTCRNAWFFGDDLKPRKPTSEEVKEIAADERIQAFLLKKQEGMTPKDWL